MTQVPRQAGTCAKVSTVTLTTDFKQNKDKKTFQTKQRFEKPRKDEHKAGFFIHN